MTLASSDDAFAPSGGASTPSGADMISEGLAGAEMINEGLGDDAGAVLDDFQAMAKSYGLEMEESVSVESVLFPLLLEKADLNDPNSITYQIAKSYVPFLASNSYEKICQEPASLENQLHFIGHDMESMAKDNVNEFLENATVVCRLGLRREGE